MSVRRILYEKPQPNRENMAVAYLHSPHRFSDLNLELLSNSLRGSKMSGTGSGFMILGYNCSSSLFQSICIKQGKETKSRASATFATCPGVSVL